MNLKLLRLMDKDEAGSTGGTGTETTVSTSTEATEVLVADSSNAGEGTPVDDNWVDLAAEGDADTGVADPVAATEPKTEDSAQTAAPVVTKVEAPAIPDAAAVVTPKVEAAPAVETPAAAVAETAEQKAARETAQTAAEAKDFQTLSDYYALPEEMVAQLQTEPEIVLPQLAAKVHKAVMLGVQQMLAHQLPAYIAQSSRVDAAETSAKSAFYGRWPTLKGYEQQVLQAGRLFRDLNPKADSKVAIETIGKIVSESLGIAIAAPGGTPVVGTTVLSAAVPAGGYTPAGGGGAARAAVPASSQNEFTRMAEESDY